MKIKKIEQKNVKLLKFKLIESKIFKKKHYLKNITLEDIEFRLKKILNLIYLYHIANKKILFVGNPISINSKIKNILSHTKHIFMPKSTWINGIITNQNLYIKSLLRQKNTELNKISEKLLQLKKKSDLIVIIDEEIDLKAIKESYNSQIPVIALNSELNLFNVKTNYKVPGNFIISKNKFKNNFFYTMLISIFKKSSIIKHKSQNLAYNLSTIKIIKKIKNPKFVKKKFIKKPFYAFQKKK